LAFLYAVDVHLYLRTFKLWRFSIFYTDSNSIGNDTLQLIAIMHFSTFELLLATLVPLTNAFPAAILEAAAGDPSILARAEELSRSLAGRQAGAGAATLLFEPVPIFNADKQYINVTKGSGHEYVAPGPNDLRGPCPGLNAFANHSEYGLSEMMNVLLINP
jgi:hypothetical protein